MSAGKQDRIKIVFKTVGLYFLYQFHCLLWHFHVIVTLLKRVKNHIQILVTRKILIQRLKIVIQYTKCFLIVFINKIKCFLQGYCGIL